MGIPPWCAKIKAQGKSIPDCGTNKMFYRPWPSPNCYCEEKADEKDVH